MKRLSDDRRVQAVIISWLFVSLLEGAAGFGTPGMLAAGILVHIGFRPLLAVTLPLIGGFVATTFGAIGVPITIGIGEGLLIQEIEPLMIEVTNLTALFHLILGSTIPIAISCYTTYYNSGDIRKGLEIWKFALFAGFMFTVPMYLIAITLGPEFPSIGASLFALFIVLFVAKKRVLLPGSTYHFPSDNNNVQTSVHAVNFKVIFNTFLPYLILVSILAISRIYLLPVGDFLNSYAITFESILSTSVNHTIYPLYSPGFFLLITAIFSFMYYRVSVTASREILTETVKRVIMPFFILFFTLTLVNIMLYSENNYASMPNMLLYIAQKLSNLSFAWPLISPLIGMIGAFTTGSVTVSNLLFSSLQYETAVQNNYSPALILTLQTIGSSAGNMISIHNIVAALSVVALHHKESLIIRRTILLTTTYVLIAGLMGMSIAYFAYIF